MKGSNDGVRGSVAALGDSAVRAAAGCGDDIHSSSGVEGLAPITGELRETIRSLAIDDSVLTIGGDDFHRLCDAIDAIHAGLERENAELRRQLDSLMYECRPMTDENMAEHGWYRALDADKKPIHLDDKVYQVKGGWVYTVKSISFYHNNTTVTFACEHGFGSDSAHNVRHYHEPTVEDVLREFGIEWEYEQHSEDRAAILAEYAAKLRLAEGEDA